MPAGWASTTRASGASIPVDQDGIDILSLEASNAAAVLLTPAHQFPTGGVLSAERRRAIVDWLERQGGIALEDDYDAEFRDDLAPLGALQGVAPERIIYAGTVSKTLAPALRLGWLVVPRDLVDPVQAAQRRRNEGCPRIDQNALAVLIETGVYDRHLRRMRRLYRARRDLLLRLVGEHLPDTKVEGVAAGLDATLRLPRSLDAGAIRAEARRHGLAIEEMSRYRIAAKGPPALLLGDGRAPESAIRTGMRILAKAIARLQDDGEGRIQDSKEPRWRKRSRSTASRTATR